MSFTRVRPMQDNNVPDGEHLGIIMDATDKTLPSKYHPSGFRDVLSIRVRIFLPDSEPSLFYTVNWDWSNRAFAKTLVDLGALPERGQEFDPHSLEGMDVVVTVANEVKNDVIYCNIIQMKKALPETVTSEGYGGNTYGQKQ